MEIDIRPASSVYRTYQRLSYKPYYALAEFVDNSTASFLAHRDELILEKGLGNLPYCRIEIQYDHSERRLTIWDSAYGMELEDFTRAIVLDQPPSNRKGRNEFGMGLKTAACWFGNRWTVETTQLGSPNLYRATVDISELAVTRQERIPYITQTVSRDEHWTRITIEDVQQPIVKRTHERVRTQLSSIYRNDLRSGETEIWYQGERLSYQDPKLLVADNKLWKKDLDFSVPWERMETELQVSGWVGIQEVMTRRDSGFVLMRRGRVIIGGPDEGYRPSSVVGPSNDNVYGRIVGELNLDDWPVNQAKDGFAWNDGLEEAFIEQLREQCKDVIRMARTHRVAKVAANETFTSVDMKAAAVAIQQVLKSEPFQKFVETELANDQETDHASDASVDNALGVGNPSSEGNKPGTTGTTSTQIDYVREAEGEPSTDVGDVSAVEATPNGSEPLHFPLVLGDEKWLLLLQWQQNHAHHHWMSLRAPRPSRENEPVGFRVIEIDLNMAHPFLAPYLANRSSLDLIQRLVIGLALSETLVRAQAVNGKVDPHAIRTKMNDILKYAALAEEDSIHGQV